MWIKEIEGAHFRNLDSAKVELQQGIHWLVGQNGQGKTNFLEMIYFTLTGKSFRTSRISELIQSGENETRIRAELIKGERVCRLGLHVKDGKCKRYLGEKTLRTLDFLRIGSVLGFTARSKRLVDGYPEDRRQFLDRMVCYLEPEHIPRMSQYKKIQNQLRGILHGKKDLRLYQSFKNAAAPIAKQIIQARLNLLSQIEEKTRCLYRDIFLADESLSFSYQHKNCREFSRFEKIMMDLSAQELLRGRTLIGPHLDNLDINIGPEGAKGYASSGQVRAIVLSLKLAVRQTYQEQFGFFPILLLDDIDAELDSVRMDSLLSYLNGLGQVLISTSKYGIIKGRKGPVFEVEVGRISSERKNE